MNENMFMDELQRVRYQQIINMDELRQLSMHSDNLEDYIIRYTKHKMVEELINHIPWHVEYVGNTIRISYDLMIDEYTEFVTHWKEIKNID